MTASKKKEPNAEALLKEAAYYIGKASGLVEAVIALENDGLVVISRGDTSIVLDCLIEASDAL